MRKKTEAPKPNKKPKHSGGRPEQIKLPVIQRVTGRLMMGLPVDLALSLEDSPLVNAESWAVAVRRYPAYGTPEAAIEAGVVSECLDRLEQHADWRHLWWVLDQRLKEDGL